MADNYLKKELYKLIKTDESIFEFIQEGSLDGMWYWDLENPENEWMNTRFWEVLGYNPNEMPHSSSAWQNIIHPDDLKRATDNFFKHCEDPKYPYDQVVRYTHKDGSTVWIRCRGMAIRDANGKPVRMLGAHQEVTAFKETESKFRRSEEALRQSNDVVENIQIGLYIYHMEDIQDDRTLRMKYANPATESMTGVKVADIIGKTLDENFPYLRDMNFPQRYAEVVRSGQEKTFEDMFYGDDRVMQACFSVKAFPLPNNHLGIAFENITEKVAIQQAVELSNACLKEAQEVGGVGSWEYDMTTGNLIWSDHTYCIYGVEKDSFHVTFDNVLAHYPEGDRDKVLAAFNKTLAERSELRIDHRILAGTGETRYVQEIGKVILSEEGTPLRIVGSVVDITKRYQAEQEIRIFKIMSDTAVEGKAIADLNGNIVYANKFWAEIHGFTQEELVGKHLSMFHSPQQLEEVGRALAELLKLGYFEPRDIGHLHRNGAEFPMLMSGTVINDSSGKPQYISATAIDITERKAAEQELIHAKAELEELSNGLRASVERYKSYIEVTGQIEWTTPQDGQVEDMPNWRKYTGQSIEEVKGWGWLKAIHPDDVERTSEVWNTSVATKSIYETEYRIRRHDGAYRYFLARGIPALKDDGSIREWVGTCIDITERRQAEDELKRYSAQIEASNKELESFSYSVSHDLRAPLRHINGYVDMLNKRYRDELPEKARQYLDVVTGASQKMGTLIDDLLHYSRTGRQEVRKTLMDMNLPVMEVIEELKSDSIGRKINWEVSKLPEVYADYTLMKQVWANLLGNAFKYTSKCQTAEILVNYKEDDTEFVFCISDNGDGFDMKYVHKLFGVFQRLHTEAEFEGTGIGLANVQRIVHKHNGRVWAESKQGEGAKFYFTIPKNMEETL